MQQRKFGKDKDLRPIVSGFSFADCGCGINEPVNYEQIGSIFFSKKGKLIIFDIRTLKIVILIF